MSVHIGLRWRPGHRIYRNDSTGEFQEVNSPLLNQSELLVQAALLSRPRSDRIRFDAIHLFTNRGSHEHNGTDDHAAAGA